MLPEEVEDERKEGVWGYLLPLDPKYGDKPLVLKKRTACPLPDAAVAAKDSSDKASKGKSSALRAEEAYEATKIKGVSSGGYLIGRHPECGTLKCAIELEPLGAMLTDYRYCGE